MTDVQVISDIRTCNCDVFLNGLFIFTKTPLVWSLGVWFKWYEMDYRIKQGNLDTKFSICEDF